MITDIIVLFLFKMVLLTSAEKFFKGNLLNSDYVFIPINRSLHWFLVVLTPWHFLIMDSLTWDISIRQEEVHNINSFLDHLCATNGISTKTRQRTNHVLKVTYLTMWSNNCGFHLFMFVDHFLKEYESDPSGYVSAEHLWFSPQDVESKRTLTRNYLEALFVKE
ncbi:unnamed protein product [Pocillopora meandrina]|uniref:Ubiquitin-like protease family profile domain-containing protein n=1 Tax=Pocillopora meandrina TaxID=46732 RepID=A0AAU9VXL6_9CNID|nr:unnamed protein product [Pocillopora meandrina]